MTSSISSHMNVPEMNKNSIHAKGVGNPCPIKYDMSDPGSIGYAEGMQEYNIMKIDNTLHKESLLK